MFQTENKYQKSENITHNLSKDLIFYDETE
jgi:hypothetical protein